MTGLTSYSIREIGGRDYLEDYAVDRVIQTQGGLSLHVALVCDGSGGGSAGEHAARHTARTIMAYLEIGIETSVPALLVGAVEEANREVYQELRGAGTSTVALAAVQLNDPASPYGRMFIASVGDSPIYLIRDKQLVRLNIDHVLSNEYIYAGQMARADAERMPNAKYITRIIGANDAVQVDIGFYAERGRPFVNSRRAFNIGRQGLLLHEGDTIIVASAGLFGAGEMDPASPVYQPEELIQHALDSDVQSTARIIMGNVMRRKPLNNVSLSMIFVPARARRALAPVQIPRERRRVALTVIALLLLLAVLLGVGFTRAEFELRDLRMTQNALIQTLLPPPGAAQIPE